MDLNRSFRTGKWRSASTERLLGLLPEHGKPYCISDIAKDNVISNELYEDDVFWLDDLTLTNRRASNGRSIPHSSMVPALIHRNMLFVRRSESFGVLGVLPERRARPVFDHKLTNAGSATAPSRMIPKAEPNDKSSDSLGRYRRSSSMPVNVPVNLPTETKKRHQWEFDDIDNDDDEADDGRAMVPPHEMVARTLARSEMVAFSVLEGAGRTLKGRDLWQVGVHPGDPLVVLASMAINCPSGFRFYPTEEELVTFYLRNLLEGRNLEDIHRVIPIINIYEKEPRDLQRVAGELCQNDTEQWFFFVPRQEREASGGRLSRTAGSGYWKVTGSPCYVYSTDHRVIGVKKSMVFYSGRTPNGRKTKWKMNEYKAIETITPHQNNSQAIPKLRHEYRLCRVYVASGASRAFDRRPVETIYPAQQTHHVGAGQYTSASSGGGRGASAARRPESSTLEVPVPLTMSDFEEAMGLNWEQFDWLQ